VSTFHKFSNGINADIDSCLTTYWFIFILNKNKINFIINNKKSIKYYNTKFIFQITNIAIRPNIAQKCPNKSFNSVFISYWVVFLKKTLDRLDINVENKAQSINI
jgi:hypothetical protein